MGYGIKEGDRVTALSQSLPHPSLNFYNWVSKSEYLDLKSEYDNLQGRKHMVGRYEYYAIITTYKDWQVTRHYICHSQYSARVGFRLMLCTEVSQRWMRLDGNGKMHLYILEKQKGMCWQWKNNPYCLNAPLSLKRFNTDYNRGGRTYFCYSDCGIYPHRRFAKDFVDRGLDKYLLREDEIELYKMVNNGYCSILNRHRKELKVAVSASGAYGYLPREFETLYKIGQTTLAMQYITSNEEDYHKLMKRYKTILLALKHGYDVTSNLATYLHYLDDLELCGMDLHSPKYIAPADFAKANNEVIRKAQKIRLERYEEQKKRKAVGDNEKYAKHMGKWFDFSISNEEWNITPLTSVEQFFDLGKRMHQCLASNQYYKKYSSLIMSAKNKQGEVIENLEIDLKNFIILQSRGNCNQVTEHHKAIVDLVSANMDAVRQMATTRKNATSTRVVA